MAELEEEEKMAYYLELRKIFGFLSKQTKIVSVKRNKEINRIVRDVFLSLYAWADLHCPLYAIKPKEALSLERVEGSISLFTDSKVGCVTCVSIVNLDIGNVVMDAFCCDNYATYYADKIGKNGLGLRLRDVLDSNLFGRLSAELKMSLGPDFNEGVFELVRHTLWKAIFYFAIAAIFGDTENLVKLQIFLKNFPDCLPFAYNREFPDEVFVLTR